MRRLGARRPGFRYGAAGACATEQMPEARIERMDSDTSGRRGARSAIVDALRHGQIDILVGTQMITKGFDFRGSRWWAWCSLT